MERKASGLDMKSSPLGKGPSLPEKKPSASAELKPTLSSRGGRTSAKYRDEGANAAGTADGGPLSSSRQRQQPQLSKEVANAKAACSRLRKNLATRNELGTLQGIVSQISPYMKELAMPLQLQLLKVSHWETVEKGKVIMTQAGDEVVSFYTVMAGTVQLQTVVRASTEEGAPPGAVEEERTVTLQAGETFGGVMMSPDDVCARTTITALCMCECELLVVDRKEVAALMGSRSAKSRAEIVSFLRGVEAFKVDGRALSMLWLSRFMKEKRVNVGTRLHPDHDGVVMLIKDGDVMLCSAATSVPLCVLFKGAAMGMGAVFPDVPHILPASAWYLEIRTKSTFLCLSRSDILEQTDPKLLATFHDLYAWMVLYYEGRVKKHDANVASSDWARAPRLPGHYTPGHGSGHGSGGRVNKSPPGSKSPPGGGGAGRKDKGSHHSSDGRPLGVDTSQVLLPADGGPDSVTSSSSEYTLDREVIGGEPALSDEERSDSARRGGSGGTEAESALREPGAGDTEAESARRGHRGGELPRTLDREGSLPGGLGSARSGSPSRRSRVKGSFGIPGGGPGLGFSSKSAAGVVPNGRTGLGRPASGEFGSGGQQQRGSVANRGARGPVDSPASGRRVRVYSVKNDPEGVAFAERTLGFALERELDLQGQAATGAGNARH